MSRTRTLALPMAIVVMMVLSSCSSGSGGRANIRPLVAVTVVLFLIIMGNILHARMKEREEQRLHSDLARTVLSHLKQSHVPKSTSQIYQDLNLTISWEELDALLRLLTRRRMLSSHEPSWYQITNEGEVHLRALRKYSSL